MRPAFAAIARAAAPPARARPADRGVHVSCGILTEVMFKNDGTACAVRSSNDRISPTEEGIRTVVSGGVTLLKGGREVAAFRNDDMSAVFPWTTDLFDAKTAAGQ